MGAISEILMFTSAIIERYQTVQTGNFLDVIWEERAGSELIYLAYFLTLRVGDTRFWL